MALSARPPWEPASVVPASLTTTLAEQLTVLRDHGGWDGRLTPRDAWRRVLGEVPYPDLLDLAEYPTFGPLDAWLEDLSLTDMHLNGPGREVTARRSGDVVELGLRETWHPDWYPWLVQQLRARGRGSATDVQLHGAADATWPGRRPCLLRYEVALPPLCPHGPSLTIRVLRPGQLALARLVELDVLSAAAAELLAGAMPPSDDSAPPIEEMPLLARSFSSISNSNTAWGRQRPVVQCHWPLFFITDVRRGPLLIVG